MQAVTTTSTIDIMDPTTATVTSNVNDPFFSFSAIQQLAGIPLQNQRNDGCTWLFLINGGEKSFEEEKVARDELKKIYQCFISNKLVKPEHVVCATGGTGKLFQHETITNVSKLSSVFPKISVPKVNPPQVNPTTQSLPQQQIPLKGKKKGTHTGLPNQGGGFNLGGTGLKLGSVVAMQPEPVTRQPSVQVTSDDSAIVIFIGHGSDPLSASQIPPSSEKDTGRLVFLSREAKQLYPSTALQHISNKMYDDLTDFQLTAGKTLFICQACYSGTIVEKMIKRTTSLTKHILAISTGPDHPASYDPILADAISDFFSSGWKEKTLSNFHEHIQRKYYDFPNYKQMFKENLEQTEENYEEERLETAGWAIDEFEIYQPRQIPQELWKTFRAVEQLKASISHSDGRDKEELMAHVREMEGYRFDLMRMYKHKPNYKMHMYSSGDMMGKLKMAEFLHLN